MTKEIIVARANQAIGNKKVFYKTYVIIITDLRKSKSFGGKSYEGINNGNN